MMIKGAFLILLFYVLGEGISLLINGLIPGSVCGMILLFLSLATGMVKSQDVKSVATTLTRNMALFFVPVGVGLMVSFDLIAAYWEAILAVSVLTTILVLITVGKIEEQMEKTSQKTTKKTDL